MTRLCVAALALALALPARAAEADEAMAARAVRWLVKQQHETGGFSEIPGEPEKGELGITCLVLRALADLPAPLRAEARPALDKGVAFVLRHQAADGAFVQGRSGMPTYRTSVAILALAAVDRAAHKEAIARAAEWLKGGQADDADGIGPADVRHGGFSYGPAGGGGGKGGRGGGADLSNTHLALAALKEAGVPKDDPVYARVLVFLGRCQNSSELNDGAGVAPADDGGFLYDPVPGSPEEKAQPRPSYAGMTYAGLLSLVLCDLPADDPRIQAARGWIASHYSLDENSGVGARKATNQAGLYYYYYTFSKCLAAIGAPTVATDAGERRWARDLFDALAARQKEDGSFVNQDSMWWETNPVLVTAYALNAMNSARPFLDRP